MSAVIFTPGYLLEHPLPPGILGALGLSGYGLLADVGGVGAGRLGDHVFLLIAPDPDPSLPDAGTQLLLHRAHGGNSDAAAYVTLAAELGLRRLSGYRIALERNGLRSRARLLDPATAAVAADIADRHPRGGPFSRGSAGTASGLSARLRALPAAGRPPNLADPELMREILIALTLRDDTLDGVQVAELADRALGLMQTDGGAALDPPTALAAARSDH